MHPAPEIHSPATPAPWHQQGMLTLAAREFGGAGKPPLVLLHGLLGSSRNWLTAGAALAEYHEVVALDARNHGRSPHDPEMSYPAMAADLISWLDARGWERVGLLGHSMGGKVAMLAACRHPERFTALTLVDIAPRTYFWAAHRANFTALQELDLRDLRSRAEAELRLEGRVPDAFLRKFLLTNLEARPEGGWRWAVNLPVLAAAVPALEANPLEAGDRYPGPVRVIVGGRSAYVQPEDHSVLRTHFPAVEIVTLKDSGHNPHLDDRVGFVAAVLR
jgi:pimeloyl-ACP methyl ester carboxylesterase